MGSLHATDLLGLGGVDVLQLGVHRLDLVLYALNIAWIEQFSKYPRAVVETTRRESARCLSATFRDSTEHECVTLRFAEDFLLV